MTLNIGVPPHDIQRTPIMNTQETPIVLIIEKETARFAALDTDLRPLGVECRAVSSYDDIINACLDHEIALTLIPANIDLAKCLELSHSLHQHSTFASIPIVHFIAPDTESLPELNASTSKTLHIIPQPVSAISLRAQIRPYLALHETEHKLDKALIELQCEIARRKAFETENAQIKIENKELKSFEKITRFVDHATHEFNNVLGYSTGFLDLAHLTIDPTTKSYSHLEKSKTGLTRALDIVKNLQLFSGQNQHQAAPFSFKSIVDKALQDVRKILPVGLNLTEVYNIQDEKIDADFKQIRNAIYYLCKETIESMPSPKGILGITLERIPSNEITDYHLGTSQNDMLRIRISATQESPSNSFPSEAPRKRPASNRESTLAAAHRIMQNHAALIEMSRNEQTGVTFQIDFPLSDNEAPQPPQEESLQPPCRLRM